MEEKRTHAAKQQLRRQAARAETSFEHDAQSPSAKQNILSIRTTLKPNLERLGFLD